MAQKFANNAVSQLASAITDTQTQFAVLPGAGGKFPVLAAGDFFMATITAATADGGVQREIIQVNVRSSDQFTVLRGREGTQALPFAAGTIIDARWTAGSAQAMYDAIVSNFNTANAAAAAAQTTANAAVRRNGDTMTSTLFNNGVIDGYGAFQSTSDIGGAFVSWRNRRVALQVDAPTNTAAYLLARLTKWGERHLVAIDAYAGGTNVSDPLLVLHFANQDNAWTFSGADINRGKGGYVYGTWNLNPVTKRNSNPNGGYVITDTTNVITLNWDGNYILSYVDGYYQGGLWTTNNFNPSNKAAANAQCQIAAYNNFGVMSDGRGNLPSPWVVAQLSGPGNGTLNALTVIGAWLRNQ